ncbi:LysR family transcriptional regulator [Teredinibacter purpureus]|jgi:transcriptional regulator, LysR family|uniref:LysR family transcriptional regulator n=1 Tax=Teredinibacter purpureus TaxID=2731756 RepID=UPI0005F81C3D|nr:LysR family transcriptional regulator [Teredinibacter purpureus]
MNLHGVDLNLMVALNVLLREKSVTRAAEFLGITQPAMSNALKRLRQLFDDPLLVRTSEGMKPTERAQALEPHVRDLLIQVEQVVQPINKFTPDKSEHFYRIAVSDYGESALMPLVLARLREAAPHISIDIMAPSDVKAHDVEQGFVDFVINRFDELPQSFYQTLLWRDNFTCVYAKDNPIANCFNYETYMSAQHIWVSKTGMGVGVGVNPDDVQRLGWVDAALHKLGEKRHVNVFTRHYQAALQMAEVSELIVTLPTKAAQLQKHNPNLVFTPPPFTIPALELTMAWSPLLHFNPAHQWLRRLVADVAHEHADPNIRPHYEHYAAPALDKSVIQP